ncbi:MAG: flagellar hook-associated protein FlgK [Treponemataceae bacterium]|nr:MAG: flagellar hook-associated protein FlgK [Treponemataceae bacterium]
MGSTFAGIELGKRSLMVHADSINTAGHNISNADTEGYSRQRVQIRSFDPLYRPDLEREERPGQIGQGTWIESIVRLRDELLDQRIVAQSNQESYWGTREKYYTMLEKIYNEPYDISVSKNMDEFWTAWQELSVYPDSKAARQSVVTRGETLLNSIRQENNSLEGIRTMLNGDIEATVKQVNDYARQIAGLNGEIVRVRAMGDNPNDLLDRRDLLVEKLSALVNVTTDQRDSDEFMVHMDGHILVQGSVPRGFEVVPVLEDNGYSKVVWNDTKADVFFLDQAKTPREMGGTLFALLELRDVDVKRELQTLNTMSMNFMDLVNDVHRNAVGANSTTGLDFFVEQPFVTNALGAYDRNGDGAEDTSYVFRITSAQSLRAQDQTGLQGEILINGKTGNIAVPYYPTDTVDTIVARINNSDGEVKAYLDKGGRLVFKATTASASENPDFVIRHIEDSGLFLRMAGVLQGSGADYAYDFNRPDAVSMLAGLENIAGEVGNAMAADARTGTAQYAVAPVLNPSAYMEINPALKNDVLSVAAAKLGPGGFAETGDGSAAVEIASIRNSQVMIGRLRTFDDYFSERVTDMGERARQSETALKSQIAIMDELRAMRDSISGVNIDEELADIIKFQHGYNASAKYISVVDSMIDTIINRLRA